MFLILDLAIVPERDRPYAYTSQPKWGVQGEQQGRSLEQPSGRDIKIALRVKGRQCQIIRTSCRAETKLWIVLIVLLGVGG